MRRAVVPILPSMRSIAVIADPPSPDLTAQAAELAKRTSLPLATMGPSCAELLLAVTPTRLELRTVGPNRTGPVFVDLLGGPVGQRRGVGSLRRQLIARAIGFKHAGLRVVDATAGLGRDAFLMAWLGCHVTAIERSPVIAALLADGLNRAAAEPALAEAVSSRLRLVEGDARDLLPRLAADQPPDVTYVDTMFSPKAKSALARKEMRICRLVTGDDEDASELVATALAHTVSRVVVKRWLRSAALRANPDITYRGKTIRYDVYLPHAGRRG